VPLDAFHGRDGEQVVTVPAGTVVPLQVELEGPLLGALPGAGLPIMLKRSIEVALRDGQPDGRYRVAGSAWHRVQDGLLLLRIDRIRPQLEAGKPVFRAHATFAVDGLEEAQP